MSDELTIVDDLESLLDQDSEPENSKDIVTHTGTLYKKWHRGGFLAVTPFFQAGRVSVDIGSIDPTSKAFIGHTKLYVPYFAFLTYLQAVAQDRAIDLYPQNTKLGINTIEGWVSYGGYYNDDKKPISRIFKSHYWGNADAASDTHKFAFKCGHFEAKVSSTGAFIPDLSKPLSSHQAQITRTEIAELALRIQTAFTVSSVQHAMASGFNTWLDESMI